MKTGVKTAKAQYADINYASSKESINSFTNYLKQLNDLETSLELSIEYYNLLQSNDVIDSLSKFYVKLDKEKFVKQDFEIIEYWTNKLDNTFSLIKDNVKKELGTNKSFYSQISDSIGLLVNSGNKLDDSTSPFFDAGSALYKAPNTIPIQLTNKTSKITKEICVDGGSKATALMRTNLYGICYPDTDTNPFKDNTSPHAMNLITDLVYFNRYNTLISSAFSQLKEKYNKIFKYVMYFSNIANNEAYNLRDFNSNKQIAENIVFSMNVEKFDQQVDLLLNKVKNKITSRTIKKTIANLITQNDSTKNNSTSQLNLNPNITNTKPTDSYFNTPEFSAKQIGSLGSINNLVNSADLQKSAIGKLTENVSVPSAIFDKLNLSGGVNPALNGVSVPGLDQISGQISGLTQNLNFDIASSIINLPNVPNIMPSVDMGSLTNLVGLANGLDFKNPMSIFSAAQQLKDTICNFQIPNFSFPGFDFKDMKLFGSMFKQKGKMPKFKDFGDALKKAFENILKQIVDSIEQQFKQFLDLFSDCSPKS